MSRPSAFLLRPVLAIAVIIYSCTFSFGSRCEDAETCQLINGAEAIFIGTATKHTSEVRDGVTHWFTIFDNHEQLVGVNPTTIVWRGTEGFSESTGFEIGEKYLVFAAISEKFGLVTRHCSGNLPILSAEKRLREIRGILSGPDEGFLFGRVNTHVTRDPGFFFTITSTADGNTFKVTPEEKGNFKLNVKPGIYQLPTTIGTMINLDQTSSINVKRGGCYRTQYRSRIS